MSERLFGLRKGFDDRGRAIVSGGVFRLRRNFIVAGIGVALTLAMMSGVLGHGDWRIFGWLGAVYFVVFGGLTILRNGLRLRRRAEITASADALTVPGRSPIAVADIVEAKTVPHPGRYGHVDVEVVPRKGSSITFWMTNEEAALFLDMLGVGVGERRASFKTVVPFRQRLLPLVGGMCLSWVFLLAWSHPWLNELFVGPLAKLLFSLLFSLVLTLVAGLVPGKVVVGADGFTTRWLRRRFYAFADVADVRALELGQNAQITFRNGKKVRVHAAEEPDTEAGRGALGRALYQHLDQAIGKYRRAAGAAEAAAHLRRGKRSAKDWLAGLDSLVRGGGTGYRVAALTPELLTDVARSADGAADARVGAAAALVRIGGEEHRNTVRIAAEACAEPHAREALLRLADAESDEMVEEALRALER